MAHAQRIDAAVGIGSIDAPAGSTTNDTNHQPQSLKGGDYFSGSVDYLFFRKHIGVEAEAAVKADQAIYLPYLKNYPYRPMFYDLNAIWSSSRFHKRFAVELLGGAGALITRFQLGGCTSSKCYASSTHFMADGGGGFKMYAWRHFFIRPEARLYLINNNVEFSSARALRYGASIGYTFRERK